MAPPSNSSDSESDAPETVALSNSRKSAKQDAARIQAAKNAAKLQNKLKNREKDRKLKERAEKSRGTPNAEEAVDPEVADVDEDSGSEEVWNGVESDASSSSSQSASTEEEGDIQDDEDYAMEDLSQSKHLPDHLFSSAFSSISTKNPPLKPSKANAAPRPKKHRRPLGRPKDIIVGTRTVRTLPKQNPVIQNASRTVPTTKVRKFIDRSLGLKGKPAKAWKRAPVNIGIMKRNGPAAHFVRNPI